MATGKRAGSRRGAPASPKQNSTILTHAAGITACVIAWGYLVFSAVEFGSTAKNGNSLAWLLLTLAAIGAAASLFVGLMLALRLMSTLGLSRDDDDASTSPRPPGGRRAAR